MSQKTHNPVIFLTAALVLSGAVLIWFAWHSYASYRETTMTMQRASRSEELRGVIVHLDEVLTMSARMAAATGDLRWEERYRQYEPKLDAAIKEAMKIAPEAYSGEAATETDAANIKLVEMENRAFDLVRKGDVEKAHAILFSDEYKAQKRIHSRGMACLAVCLDDAAHSSLQREQRRASMHILAVALLIPFLAVGWAMIFRATQKWKVTLTDNNRRLARQADDLAALNGTLDRKVAERTAALTHANEKLNEEIAERERAEEKLRETLTDMERMNATMMGREERVLEMKQEVNGLLAEQGRAGKYQHV